MTPFVLHDLRRTVSIRMHEDLGIQPHIVEAVLNHVSGTRAGVAGVYNRALYVEEKRRALEAWASRLEAAAENHVDADASRVIDIASHASGSSVPRSR